MTSNVNHWYLTPTNNFFKIISRDASAIVRDGKSLESESEIARALPSDPIERSARVLKLVMDAAGNFLQSHSLQVKLAPEEVSSAARTFNEGMFIL